LQELQAAFNALLGTSGGSEGYEMVDSKFVEQLRTTTDRPSRKKLLADWWNSLESHKPIREP
jgi:hypothetical protein